MQKIKNIYAYVLASLVVIITLIAILAIWGVLPDIDYWEYIRKSLLSVFTLIMATVAITVIFRMVYKQDVRPPRPPGIGDRE